MLKKALATVALAVTGLTGCATETAEPTAAPAHNTPVATWHDIDSDGVRDTVIIFDAQGCATSADFYNHAGSFTGYRVEAGTQCMTTGAITETLKTFIDLNGGI